MRELKYAWLPGFLAVVLLIVALILARLRGAKVQNSSQNRSSDLEETKSKIQIGGEKNE